MKNLFFILIVLTGCAPVYTPNLRNTPLFTKAGEFQASAQLGNGIDAQAAVAVSNHIGLMSNFSYADRSGVEDPDQYHYHKLFEGGVGYFENYEKICFEIFAGYGKGEGAGYDKFNFISTEEVRAKGEFNRYFIQPAIGFNRKMFHASFSSRISFVDMYAFTNEVTGTTYPQTDLAVYFEPAVMGKLNMADNHLFFTFQAGASAVITGETPWDYRPFQWGMGMGFRLGGEVRE